MADLRRIAHMSLAKGYGVALSLAMLFLSARLLGPDGRGAFAAALAWAALFATCANLSLGQALQHRIQASPAKLSLSQQLGTLGGLAVLLATLALLFAVSLYQMSAGAIFRGLDVSILWLAFAAVPFLIWEQFSSNIAASVARTDILNKAQYIGRTAGFLLFLIFVPLLAWQVQGALAAQLAGQVAVAALTFVPLWRLAGKRAEWRSDETGPLLRAGGLIHLTTVSAFLLDQVSVLLINHHLTSSDVGHYQLAQQMLSFLLIVPQSALMVIYGGIANTNPDRFWPKQRKLAVRVLVLMTLGGLLAYMLAPTLVEVVAGEQFSRSASIFQVLLPSLFGYSLALLMTPQWISRGLLVTNTSLTVATSAAVVAASFWAIPKFGIDGAIGVRLAVFAVWVPLMQLAFWHWCSLQSAKAARQDSER